MSGPPRRIASPAFAVLAAIALIGSLIGGYAWRAVFDSEQFAERAAAALDNEAVRDEIGRRVADELVAGQPNLISVRPVLESVTAGIAGSSAFQSIFRAGVADVHRTFFDEDADTVTLTLADLGATIRERWWRCSRSWRRRSRPPSTSS